MNKSAVLVLAMLCVVVQLGSASIVSEICTCDSQGIVQMCGSDGVSYSDRCFTCAKKSNPDLYLKHNGPCSDAEHLPKGENQQFEKKDE